MITAPEAATAATPSDSFSAPSTRSSCASWAYHLVEKPAQTVTSLDSLNE